MKDSNELINDIQLKAYKVANSFLLKYYRFFGNKFKEHMEKAMSDYIFEITSMRPIIIITSVVI